MWYSQRKLSLKLLNNRIRFSQNCKNELPNIVVVLTWRYIPLLMQRKVDPILKRIVTCEKNLILYDNRKRSWQWCDREENAIHQTELHPKPFMCVWWTSEETVNYSFLNSFETKTTEYQCDYKVKSLPVRNFVSPPYSPDLSPTDYHLFWNLGNYLQDRATIQPKRYNCVLFLTIRTLFKMEFLLYHGKELL